MLFRPSPMNCIPNKKSARPPMMKSQLISAGVMAEAAICNIRFLPKKTLKLHGSKVILTEFLHSVYKLKGVFTISRQKSPSSPVWETASAATIFFCYSFARSSCYNIVYACIGNRTYRKRRRYVRLHMGIYG